MRRGARTDLCGGRSAMVVPTATVSDVVQPGIVPISAQNGRQSLAQSGEERTVSRIRHPRHVILSPCVMLDTLSGDGGH
jgi:hypothetical protein